MKLCKIEDLRGGETLAKDVLTSELRVVLSEGIKLRKDYIDKIRELGIREVYIKEEKQNSKEITLLKEEIKKELNEKVRNIIEKHTYLKSNDLEQLTKEADLIISSVLEEEEVVEKIYDIKERSADIYEHSVNVCSLATLTALKLRIPKSRIHDLAVGSLLHDLGLRYLTTDYNGKELNQMGNADRVEYMKHPVYGYTALKDETWISELGKQIILCHHECMDGSGYPLKIKNISEEAKLVGICDTFDEMICGIGHQRQKVYQAVEYLKTFQGMKYDKEMIKTFLQFTAVYPVGSEVVLNNGVKAVVAHQNKEFPDRPIVKVIDDPSGKYKADKEIDLILANHLFVEKVLE